MTPGAPAYPGPLAALLLSFAALLASVFLTALFMGGSLILAVGLGQALGVGAVATLAARRVPEPQAERLGMRGFDLRLLAALAALLPGIVLVSEVDNVVAGLLPAPASPSEISEEAEALSRELDLDSTASRVQLALIGVGIAPVVEEWLFRGVLQQGLVSHLGRLRGVLLTALLFAPLHPFATSAGTTYLSAAAAAFALGSVLGLVRLATGSILACMVLSGALRAVGLAAVWAEDNLAIPGFNAEGAHTPLAVLVPCAAVAAAGFAPLWRRATVAPVDPEPAPRDEPPPG